MSQAQNAPARPSRPQAQSQGGVNGFRPVALPAVAAAVQVGGRETPRSKLTVKDFPAILRRDTALDF